jgi:signal transduction histidine kinase
LLNAIEAMGARGELTIRVRQGNTHNATSVVAEVRDTGPGIPESIRSDIFNPFFTTKPRGSGLGLTICRGITDAHRGTIRVESASNRPGTTIVVEFPAATSTPELAQQNALKT